MIYLVFPHTMCAKYTFVPIWTLMSKVFKKSALGTFHGVINYTQNIIIPNKVFTFIPGVKGVLEFMNSGSQREGEL